MNISDWLILSIILNAVMVFAHWRSFKMLGGMYQAMHSAQVLMRAIALGEASVRIDENDRVKITNLLRRNHGK